MWLVWGEWTPRRTEEKSIEAGIRRSARGFLIMELMIDDFMERKQKENISVLICPISGYGGNKLSWLMLYNFCNAET